MNVHQIIPAQPGYVVPILSACDHEGARQLGDGSTQPCTNCLDEGNTDAWELCPVVAWALVGNDNIIVPAFLHDGSIVTDPIEHALIWSFVVQSENTPLPQKREGFALMEQYRKKFGLR